MDIPATPMDWKDLVEKHVAGLAAEIEARVASALADAEAKARAEERQTAESAVAAAREEARVSGEAALTGAQEEAGRRAEQQLAESLNSAVRRLREAASEDALFGSLVDLVPSWTQRAAVFTFRDGQACAAHLHHLGADAIEFTVTDAPSLVSAVETREPLVALASTGELGSTLAAALEGGSSRVYLFPIVSRLGVSGVLVADGVIQAAPLELLSEAAGLRLDSFAAVPVAAPVTSGLTQIAPAASPAPRSWSDLSSEEQATHLRAQRFARVRVAEIRLRQAEALRNGRENGNIYASLRPEIDAARETFDREFVSHCPSMVDYLHVELIRSLTHEEESLLGPEYPGPLV